MVVPASESGGTHVANEVVGLTESGVVEHTVSGSGSAEHTGEDNGGVGGTVRPVTGALGISSVGSIGGLKTCGNAEVDTVEKVCGVSCEIVLGMINVSECKSHSGHTAVTNCVPVVVPLFSGAVLVGVTACSLVTGELISFVLLSGSDLLSLPSGKISGVHPPIVESAEAECSSVAEFPNTFLYTLTVFVGDGIITPVVTEGVTVHDLSGIKEVLGMPASGLGHRVLKGGKCKKLSDNSFSIVFVIGELVHKRKLGNSVHDLAGHGKQTVSVSKDKVTSLSVIRAVLVIFSNGCAESGEPGLVGRIGFDESLKTVEILLVCDDSGVLIFRIEDVHSADQLFAGISVVRKILNEIVNLGVVSILEGLTVGEDCKTHLIVVKSETEDLGALFHGNENVITGNGKLEGHSLSGTEALCIANDLNGVACLELVSGSIICKGGLFSGSNDIGCASVLCENGDRYVGTVVIALYRYGVVGEAHGLTELINEIKSAIFIETNSLVYLFVSKSESGSILVCVESDRVNGDFGNSVGCKEEEELGDVVPTKGRSVLVELG